jgi:hypothetical protein
VGIWAAIVISYVVEELVFLLKDLVLKRLSNLIIFVRNYINLSGRVGLQVEYKVICSLGVFS